MSKSIAWNTVHNVISPRLKELGIKGGISICSTEDWDNGVAISLKQGVIHALGNGEIVDEKNILKH